MKLTKRIVLMATALILLGAMALFTVSCGGGEPAETTHTHSYTSNVVAPSCTAGGYTLYTCACGHSYQDSAVPAAHDLSSRVARFPTTLTKGLRVESCSKCDYEKTYEIDTVTVTLPGISESLATMLGEGTVSFDIGEGSFISATTNREEYDANGANTGSSSAVETLTPVLKKATFSVEGTELTGEIELEMVMGNETGVLRFYLVGDDVSVELDGETSEANLSDLYYDTLCSLYEIDRATLEEGYFFAEKLGEYVTVLEALETLLVTEIPACQYSILDLLAEMGAEIVSVTTEAGVTTYELDVAAALAVLGGYGDMSLTDIIDQSYGEGAGKAFFDYLASLPEKTLGEVVDEALDLCEAYDLDHEAVFQLINYLAFTASGEDFDLEGELEERYDATIPALLAGENGDADAMKQALSDTVTLFRATDIAELFHQFACGDLTHMPFACPYFDDMLTTLEAMSASLVQTLTVTVDEETGALISAEIETAYFALTVAESVDGYEGTLSYEMGEDGWLHTGTFTYGVDGSGYNSFTYREMQGDTEYALNLSYGEERFLFVITENEEFVHLLSFTKEEKTYFINFATDRGATAYELVFANGSTDTEIAIEGVLYDYSGILGTDEMPTTVFAAAIIGTITDGVSNIDQVMFLLPDLNTEIVFAREDNGIRMTVTVDEQTIVEMIASVTVTENADGTVTETIHLETEDMPVSFDTEETKIDSSDKDYYISAYIQTLLTFDLDLSITYSLPAAE